MLPPGPDTRVVELRVHGVMGTAPETMISAVAAVDVAGDGIGRIVQPADRLLRPAPGPMLRAEGQSIPRVVEGYSWSGMTSGGAAKAAWAVLFPFSLANVTHWMLPPAPSGHRLAGRLALAARSLLRLAAVLLTVLLITQAAVVSLDLVAAQCLAPGSPCLARTVPGWLRETYLVRPLIGLVPVLLIIYMLHRISCVLWEVRSAADNPPPTPPNTRVDLPGTNLVADPDTPTLRALHLIAALATVALLPLDGPFHVPARAVEAVLWALALTLLVVSLLGVLLLDDPTGAQPKRAGAWLRAFFGPWTRRALLATGGTLVAAAAAIRDPLPAKLTGTEQTVEAVAAALIVLVVLLGVLLVPAALIARREWRRRPRELRPWAGGWMAAPVLALAALLGGGFGAGLGITVRQLLGTEGMRVPPGYVPITLLWGAGAVLGALFALVAGVATAFAVVRLRAGRYTGDEAAVRLLHEGRPREELAAARAWRGASWQRLHLQHVVQVSAGVLSAGAVVGIYFRFAGVPDWLRPLSTIGVLALGVFAGGLLRVVFNAARAPDTGRRLGVLADLACFWPREAHPIVPPCYAIKVAPELAARTVEHLRDPGTRVVLCGESHGSLLVTVAAARLLNSLNEPDRRRIGVVTVGSQLLWAYTRAFPAVLPHAALGTLAGELGTRWRSLCRGTDPLGGAITTWQRQVHEDSLLGIGFRPDGTSGPLPAAVRGPSGALVLGLDHWLPDPARGPFAGRRWTPGVRGHRDYTADPEWDRAVAMAAGLDPTEPTLGPLMR